MYTKRLKETLSNIYYSTHSVYKRWKNYFSLVFMTELKYNVYFPHEKDAAWLLAVINGCRWDGMKILLLHGCMRFYIFMVNTLLRHVFITHEIMRFLLKKFGYAVKTRHNRSLPGKTISITGVGAMPRESCSSKYSWNFIRQA